MFNFRIDLITGLMFGIEFPVLGEPIEDLQFCMVIDLGIFRFSFLKWDDE